MEPGIPLILVLMIVAVGIPLTCVLTWWTLRNGDTVKFFGYGSLAGGDGDNYLDLEGTLIATYGGKFVGVAAVEHWAKRFTISDGAFPGLVWGTCDDRVEGRLYEIPKHQLEALTEFQGLFYTINWVIITEGLPAATLVFKNEVKGA